MRILRQESTTTWTRSPLGGADPLLLALALCATLVYRLNPRRSNWPAVPRSLTAAPSAFAVGSASAAVRPHRRAVSAPLAFLALTTLATHWCWETRRRTLLAVSASTVLAAQLVLASGGAWPVPLGLAASIPAPTFPRGFPALTGLAQLSRLPRMVWPAQSTGAHLEPAGGQDPGGAEPAAAPLLSVVSAVPADPAAPGTRAPWHPSGSATAPYPERIEAWRPLVRELLAEAWQEGRLDGPASLLDDDLVLALIRQESGGNPDALSWAGAMGLMQVMPFTFAEMMHGDRSLTCAVDRAAMWDVRSNARAGLRYLALAMQAHEGNLYWALASYNAGIEAVHYWRAAGLYAVPPIGGYTETAAYAPAILRDYLHRRPDVTLQVPTSMLPEHVPGAVRLLRELDAARPARPPEVYPRCGGR